MSTFHNALISLVLMTVISSNGVDAQELTPREKKKLDELPESIAALMSAKRYGAAELRQKKYIALLNRTTVDEDIKVRASLLLAQLLSLNGKLDEAELVVRKTLAQSDDWSGNNQLIGVLLKKGKYSEAEQLASKNIDRVLKHEHQEGRRSSIDTEHLSRSHLQLGHAQFCLGKIDEAKENYERSLTLAQESEDRRTEIEALRALANLYKAKKLPEMASDYEKKAELLERSKDEQ